MFWTTPWGFFLYNRSTTIFFFYKLYMQEALLIVFYLVLDFLKYPYNSKSYY